MNTQLTITASESIGKLLVMILVGFSATKLKLMKDSDGDILTKIVINVINPMTLLSSFMSPYDPEKTKGFLQALCLSLILHVVGILLGYIFVKKKEGTPWQVERLAIAYGNTGFIGIPLVSAMFGSEAVFYISAVIMVFNIMIWTHGTIVMRGSMKKEDIKPVLTSPSMIAIYIGIIVYLLRIPIPDILVAPISAIGNSITPISMLVSGCIVANSEMKTILRNFRAYRIVALRLIGVPLLLLFIIKALHMQGIAPLTAFVAGACPIATLVTMLAVNYNKDKEYVAGLFAIAAILSLITIPLMVSLYGIII